MTTLPSCFVLQSGGKYLSLTENIPTPNLPSGFLKFDEEQIRSPRTKFVAEPAAGAGGLFHIRSLYNNKYLVTKQIGSKSWIVASAEKPEEDTSKGASCTLFQPHSLPDDDDQSKTTTVRLRHVGTGISATRHSNDDDGVDDSTHQGVLLSSTSSVARSSFVFTDSSSVLVLPSRVAFKSVDLNGNYLGSAWLYGKYMYQRFEAGLDIGDQRVANELIHTSPQSEYYRIKDLYNDKFWKLETGNWIKADDDSGRDYDCLFSVVHVQDNVVALLNMNSDCYCGAYTEGGSVNCLRAEYPTLSKQTRLILEEVVLRRVINDVDYRLPDSRVYDEQPIEVDHQFASNYLQTDSTMTLEFTPKESRTTSWNNSVSIQFGVTLSFEVSAVPLIEKSNVSLSFEAGYTHEWGGEVTTERERKMSYTVTVPPLKTVKVTMLATTGKCDVPFSYTQRDLLPSGRWDATRKDDGIFKGINSYNVHFKSEYVNPDDDHKATADTNK
uniref:uncharacterized protein LOC122607117 n=1 Tax=Erigeron canadensis TaxID=72917 RepID=UPI001CB92FE2|nr:uncharacterized protein LOC122607117 [Erigeron canadensis]